MATVIRDKTGDCSYDGGHTWQKCPTTPPPTNSATVMANLQVTPALANLVSGSQDTLTSIANFVVDNNQQGVYAVLKQNGYTFNTPGEAAIIVRSILVGTTPKIKNEFSQLSKVPYLNNNTNGTGALYGAATTSSISSTAITPQLICTVSSLFGMPLGCDTQPTADDLAKQQAAADAAKKKSIIIAVSVIGGLIIIGIFTVIIIKNKKKNKKSE